MDSIFEKVFGKNNDVFAEMKEYRTVSKEQATQELRDRFAIAALQGMMATRREGFPNFKPEDDAAYCYKIADAMLKARKATTQRGEE